MYIEIKTPADQSAKFSSKLGLTTNRYFGHDSSERHVIVIEGVVFPCHRSIAEEYVHSCDGRYLEAKMAILFNPL